jgi:serine protease inhibitor
VKGKIPVLLGAEIALYESPNDYLVYGITEDFLRNNGDLMAYTLKDFYNLCKKNGLMVVQAHPFRHYIEPVPPRFIDGVEVYNANASHNGYSSHNAINSSAEQWAKRNKKNIVTAGSDFHDVIDAMTGGIYFEKPVNSNEDLLRELKSLNYTLYKGGFKC